ncbi:MAG TPA: DUF4232 domain-containing protein [Acidimicrobiales bacterium]|jgi:hypothetical protein
MGRRGYLIAAAVAVVVIGLVVWWAIARDDSGGSSNATTTTTTSVGTTTTAPSGSTTSTAPRLGACATSALTISIGAPEGTAGHFEYQIAFRNTSGATCGLTGFPGVSFVDGSGNQVGVPAARSPLSFSTVTLVAGSTADAHLQVTDPSVLDCAPAAPAAVRVYPPDQTAFADVPVTGLSICPSNPGTIDPVKAAS